MTSGMPNALWRAEQMVSYGVPQRQTTTQRKSGASAQLKVRQHGTKNITIYYLSTTTGTVYSIVHRIALHLEFFISFYFIFLSDNNVFDML